MASKTATEIITQTKKLGRIVDTTTEPYREWHTPNLKHVLDPKQCVVVISKMLDRATLQQLEVTKPGAYYVGGE